MKFINDCLVLNKEDADGIMPILIDDLKYNSMMYARHVDKIHELPQGALEITKKQIKILVPFFIEWMHQKGKIDDSEYKLMKSTDPFEFALQGGRERERAKLKGGHQ